MIRLVTVMGCRKQSIVVYLLTSSAILLTPAGANAKSVEASLRTTVGANLDPTNSDSSLSLAPLLKVDLGEDTLGQKRSILFYLAIDRPFKAYDNFSLPLAVIKFSHGLDIWPNVTTSVSGSLTGINVQRWAHDGTMTRATGSFSVGREVTKDLSFTVVIGVYGQLNQYAQTTSGASLPDYGFNQRLSVSYRLIKPLVLGTHFSLDQRHAAQWKNGYRFYQQVAYEFSDKIVAGIAHEFVGSAVDDSTGYYRPVTFFDSRESRVSAFVDVSL